MDHKHAEGPATALTVSGPLNLERFGRQLDLRDIADVQERQASYIVRRLAVQQSLAAVIAEHVFLEARS